MVLLAEQTQKEIFSFINLFFLNKVSFICNQLFITMNLRKNKLAEYSCHWSHQLGHIWY